MNDSVKFDDVVAPKAGGSISEANFYDGMY